MRSAVKALSIILLCSNPLFASTPDEEYQRNAFATAKYGAWTTTAALFDQNYTYGPQYQCRIESQGVAFWQARPNESGEMFMAWSFAESDRRDFDNFEVSWVSVGGDRFEVTRLPWRLIGESTDGIVLTFDRTLLSVRRDRSHPWMPFNLLTLEMLKARHFEIGFTYELDEKEKTGTRRIDLTGIKDAAKWCGRNLLRDRQDQPAVLDLIR